MTKKILISMLALFAIATTAGAQNTIDGHEYVDLELPSGLLWATVNVGGRQPKDLGSYFAWGETTPGSKGTRDFSWSTYKWANGAQNKLTKYCYNSYYGNNGFTDDLTTLLPEDDAARAQWGGKWRMPTTDEFQELVKNTTQEWTTLSGGEAGCTFTSKKNGKSIFLRAANCLDGKNYAYSVVCCVYWSSSVNKNKNRTDYAMRLSAYWKDSKLNIYYTAGGQNNSDEQRSWGLSVRPVISKKDVGIFISLGNFPDKNFRSYVSTNFDKDKNGYLSDEEIAAVTEIDVRAKNISDLTGIHYFTNLKTLNCTENNLTSLDVSANTELTTLYCSINQLSALDVSKNKKLTTLYCYYNQIGKDAMQTLVNGLPRVSNRQFRAINMDGINNGKEKNFITPAQVEAAKNKGWNVWGKCDVDGTFKWQEFAGAVTITATANNADYGTVTGTGIYEKGRNVTLKATRNRGYKFVKWTANGTQVSTDATYTFTADGDKEYTAVFEKETTNPKTLAVTFTKATTLLTELSAQDKIVLSAVTTLAEQEKLAGYSVVVDSRRGTTTLKKDTKTLFGVDANNKRIIVPSGVTSSDNINVTLTRDLRQALGTTLAPQLASYDAIQVKFEISTPTAIDASLNDNGKIINDSWYTIDGVKLSGEPTKKGIYIHKGKKVKK